MKLYFLSIKTLNRLVREKDESIKILKKTIQLRDDEIANFKDKDFWWNANIKSKDRLKKEIDELTRRITESDFKGFNPFREELKRAKSQLEDQVQSYDFLRKRENELLRTNIELLSYKDKYISFITNSKIKRNRII